MYIYIGRHVEFSIAGIESSSSWWRIPRAVAGRRLVRFHCQSHNLWTGSLGQQQQRWRTWRIHPAGHGHAGSRHVWRDIKGVVRKWAQLLVAPAVISRLFVVPQQGAVKHIAWASSTRGHRWYICRRERDPDVEGWRAR